MTRFIMVERHTRFGTEWYTFSDGMEAGKFVCMIQNVWTRRGQPEDESISIINLVTEEIICDHAKVYQTPVFRLWDMETPPRLRVLVKVWGIRLSRWVKAGRL